MTLRIVQLGSPRQPGEGLRIGTVRRPPRGVPKSRYSSDDWYDVWLPELAPSAAAVKRALAAETPAEWKAFVKRSVACYCEDESRCHRSVLRELLREHEARLG
jgi:uncharacterized protein YeaO (DUF488 family)